MDERPTRAPTTSIELLRSGLGIERGNETAVATGLLAQQAADETGRTITLIIIALLVVAALLAALTVWYWRFTDPKKRLLTPVPAPIGDSDDFTAGGHTAVAPPAEANVIESDVGITEAERATAEALADDGADEWLRLTGPQAARRAR